ncbi:MAG: transporter, partial [Betaproteobacteria bacterium]|nr:transporter [Betaproteobacteria bacterium]
SESGVSNSSLGLKWLMREGDEATGKAALAWLAHLETNSGSAALRGSGVVPSLRLVAEWSLPGDAAFGVMPGLAWQKNDAGDRHWSAILAATYSRPLGPSVRGFLELAGREMRRERHGGNQVTFDAGLAYALDKDTQLDPAINLGLNRFTPDALITVGFSKRFR